MLICSIFLFAGCSSAVQYSIYYQDGSRSTEFQIKVDKDACTNLGLDPDKIMQKVTYYAQKQADYLRTNGKNLNGVTIKNGVDSSDNFAYNFILAFDSFQAYCDFYGTTQEDLDEIEPEIESGLYVSKYIVQRFLFVGEDGKFNLQSLENYLKITLGYCVSFNTIYNDFRINICNNSTTLCDQLMDKIQLNIVKCFPTQYGYRSNANQVGTVKLPTGINSQNYTYYTAHFWSGTILNPPQEILIYRNYVLANNRVAWYVTAIILTAIFGAILAIILCAKSNKQKSSSTPQSPQTDDNSAQNDQNSNLVIANGTSVNAPLLSHNTSTPSPQKTESNSQDIGENS